MLAVGGLVSLLLGSMMLVDSPLPELRVGLRLIVPMTLAVAGIAFSWSGWRCRRSVRPRSPGRAACWPRPAGAVSFGPGGVGRVQTHGEIWTATADVPIHAGDTVRVVAVDGLRLTVASSGDRPASDRVEPLPGPRDERAWRTVCCSRRC